MRLHQIVRRLIQLPAFTTIAVVTLAVGIGANAAIFSVVQGVLLKPLPYPRPDELVVLDHSALGIGLKSTGAAPFLYYTYREDGRVFQSVGLWTADTESVTGLAEPEEVRSLVVTEGLLEMLGAVPARGRLFNKEDDSPQGAETVILSNGYWRSRLGGDPAAIGRRLLVNGRAREIVGVLPESFRFLDQKPSLVLPMRLDRDQVFLGNFSYTAMARVKSGVTLEQVRAESARLIPIGLTKFPPFAGFSVQMFYDARLVPNPRLLKADVVGDVGPVLWVLMGTIAIVLLIACANVANLLLVRAEGRQQELAVRAALGASRGRIAYELIAESLVLGIVGGAAGLALAFGAVRVLVSLAPGNLPRLDDISVDAGVVLFTVAVSILAGLLFGSIPIVRYVGPHVAAGLRGGGRTFSAGRERHRARSALVVVQVGLAAVLLVSSGLMLRTFQALRHVNPGFSRPDEVLTFRLTIPSTQVKEPEAVIRMHQAIAERIRSIPGVKSVGLTSLVPMTDAGWHDPIFAADKDYEQGKLPPIRLFKFISPGLLATLGTPLVTGRDFTWADTYQKRPVAMVSENLARELWGDPQTALGKRIRENHNSAWREIVGVVADVHDEGAVKKPPAATYWPMLMSQFEGDDPMVRRSMVYVARSLRAGSSALREDAARAVWAVNPNLPLANVRTLESVVSASMARTSFTLVMLAIAGGMALLLGVAGIYGVIAYSVSQRTREIGIRVALGAQRTQVTGLFVRHGLALAAAGIAGGLAISAAVTRVLASLLFQVSPVDASTYAAVCGALAGAAVLASYVPARGATLVDPAAALRAE